MREDDQVVKITILIHCHFSGVKRTAEEIPEVTTKNNDALHKGLKKAKKLKSRK